jgi:hypothetical protein
MNIMVGSSYKFTFFFDSIKEGRVKAVSVFVRASAFEVTSSLPAGNFLFKNGSVMFLLPTTCPMTNYEIEL